MTSIVLELVPTSITGGAHLALEEARKVKALLETSGLLDRIDTLLVPQITPEEGDRPISLEEKMDPLDFSQAVSPELPLSFIFTQVTPFIPVPELKTRVQKLSQAGIERLVFVGVPRVMEGRTVVGPMPGEAVQIFREQMPSRGVILIPTRPDEEERFTQKLDSGATFALTQLLYSDEIVQFLQGLRRQPHRPEVLLSFGYVPQVETKVGLLRWLIQDAPAAVQGEMAFVAEVAGLPFKEKKARLVDLYKRVVDGASKLGFPLGLHFECPYGVSEPALETFSAMLDHWPPD
jgi:hypothetical protein